MKHKNKLWPYSRRLYAFAIIGLIGAFAISFTACDDSSDGGKTQVAKPALTQSQFNHTGEPFTVTLNPSNTAAYTLTGDVTKTEIGDYTAIVTLTANYEWADGTTAPLNLDWKIVSGENGGDCECDGNADTCECEDCECDPCNGGNCECDGNADTCECEDCECTECIEIGNKIPTEADFEITGLVQIFDDTEKEVDITAKAGKSSGDITVSAILHLLEKLRTYPI